MASTAINIHDAKTQFSRLVARAERGETVDIARAGKTVARLVGVQEPVPEESREARAARRIGSLKGQFTVPDDFDTMFQDEIIAMFEGKYEGGD